ncbi:uncharacterized protein LOC121396402 [Xenopus laevis]|uniref:Uncharacterized protein LOC121396402 n=1 Tax=Xenopus laevis TaxID=8355 RepID=A0A8J1LCK5_XENLA|nr:uncharacterized protein LOC121396402 [Xenopus laevis]
MAQQDSGSVGSPGGVTGTPDRLHSDTTPPIFRIQTAGQRLRQKQIPLRHTRPRLSGNHTTRSPKAKGRGYYSNLFMVPKKDGSLRPVLRPQGSQSLRQKCHFKMESIQSVLSSMEENEFMTVIDIKDAYLHIPIHPAHHGFLRFYVNGQHWQFVALPFGLSSAPRTFTKVTAAALEDLRLTAYRLSPIWTTLGQGSIRTSNPPSHIPRPTEPNHTGLDDQLHQVETSPNSVNRVPGSHPRLQTRESLPATRQGRDPSEPNSISPGTPPHSPSSSHADSGHDGCLLPGDSVCTSPHQISSTHHPSTPTQRSNQPRSPDCHPEPSADLSSMVASPTSDISGKTISTPSLDGPNHRCQSTRVGRSRRPNHCTGPLDSGRNETAHQPPGAQSDTLLPRTHGAVAPGTTGADTVRQRDGRSLHKSSGRNQKSQCPQGSSGDPKVGRRQCSSVIRGPHSRRGQLDSRLSEQGNHRSRGMEPPPRCVPPTSGQVGATRDRPHGFQDQQTGPAVRLKKPGSPGPRSGRPRDSLALLQGLRLPPSHSPAKGRQENKERRNSDHSGGSILAQEVMVHGHCEHGGGRTLPSTAADRPTHPGSGCPPEFSSLGFNGVALEALILRKSGAPAEAIPTMLRARKPVSAKIYHRVWKTFISWCEQRDLNPQKAGDRETLSFLQDGLAKGLALSSLKVQVSALSILLRKKLAMHPNIQTFLQGATRLIPPYCCPIPPWDLNLVLSALQEDPFEPLDQVPLSTLTEKVVFLLAITSARRVSDLAALSCRSPFTVLHMDKVVLRPTADFLPKVVSDFHLNQDIVVPSLCPNPKGPIENKLHTLDVVRAISCYLKATEGVRRSDALFIIPNGPKRGTKAAKSTLSKWIRSIISRAYAVKGKDPPIHVRAHSTRSVSTSWAFRHNASADQICKAATWASLHTFTRFYRLHTHASADAAFGRKVLSAVIS